MTANRPGAAAVLRARYVIPMPPRPSSTMGWYPAAGAQSGRCVPPSSIGEHRLTRLGYELGGGETSISFVGDDAQRTRTNPCDDVRRWPPGGVEAQRVGTRW